MTNVGSCDCGCALLEGNLNHPTLKLLKKSDSEALLRSADRFFVLNVNN
jgi:hypothetical protein